MTIHLPDDDQPSGEDEEMIRDIDALNREMIAKGIREIARAFLVPEKTMRQRIYRTKKTLAEAHVPFESPRGDELRRRMDSVLLVVYLIFNAGYTARAGTEWTRGEGATKRCDSDACWRARADGIPGVALRRPARA